MAMTKQEKNNEVLRAVGHPVRRAILRKMESHPRDGVSPKELAEELGMSIPAVSYHIHLLLKPGFLKLVKTAQRRGALEHFYARSGNSLDRRVTDVMSLMGKD